MIFGDVLYVYGFSVGDWSGILNVSRKRVGPSRKHFNSHNIFQLVDTSTRLHSLGTNLNIGKWQRLTRNILSLKSEKV